MSSVFSRSLFLSAFAGSKLDLATMLLGFFGALRTNFVAFLGTTGLATNVNLLMSLGIGAGLKRSCDYLPQLRHSISQFPVSSKFQSDKSSRVILPIWGERNLNNQSEQCRPALI